MKREISSTRLNSNRSILFMMVLMYAIISSCSNVRRPPKDLSWKLSIDSALAAYADFSGVVLVAQHGKVLFHQAQGYRNFETKVPLDTLSIFELASVSKQFTAAVVLSLADQGLLSVDDPVEKYLPGLPYPGITIRHLLNHTSGLPDYQSIMDEHWDKSRVAGNNDNIRYLIQFHPPSLFEPGARYEYSNTGYMLLASIAEKASGEDFIAYSRSHIFEPLNMSGTDIRTQEYKAHMDRMAWGHIWVPEKQRFIRADSFPAFNYAIWLGDRKGPGRISSTSSDLLKWDQALYSEQVLKASTIQQAYEPAKLNDGTLSNYGFGWELEQHPVMGKVVRHSGDNPGYKTQIIRYLDRDKTIIVLCNNAHAQFGTIVNHIEKAVQKMK